MILKPGTRVYHRTGRMGTVEGKPGPHSGYRVRFDEKVYEFEPAVARVSARDMTPTDPKLHEEWEAAWPAFDQPHRGWAREAVVQS